MTSHSTVTTMLAIAVVIWSVHFLGCVHARTLCHRLDLLSRIPKTPLELKAFFLTPDRQLYLIDEKDDLYRVDLTDRRLLKELTTNEQLLLYQENGTVIHSVGKWYNTPWLRVKIKSPLAKLSVYQDAHGQVWRQYLFIDGQHRLINNRTGRVVLKKKQIEFLDHSIINEDTGDGSGYLLHYNHYAWREGTSAQHQQTRRVVIRPLASWDPRNAPLSLGSAQHLWTYVETNEQRNIANFGVNLSHPNSQNHRADLMVDLPMGGFISQHKVFLLTPYPTREVIILKQTPHLLTSKGKPVHTKPWTDFFRCSRDQPSSDLSAVNQAEYVRLAELGQDDRTPMLNWLAIVGSHVISIILVLTSFYLLYLWQRKSPKVVSKKEEKAKESQSIVGSTFPVHRKSTPARSSQSKSSTSISNSVMPFKSGFSIPSGSEEMSTRRSSVNNGGGKSTVSSGTSSETKKEANPSSRSTI